MEQALAAILDEAAARAQEEDRLAEEAAERGGEPLGFIEEEEEAEQASSGESKGAVACHMYIFLLYVQPLLVAVQNQMSSRTKRDTMLCTCGCKH